MKSNHTIMLVDGMSLLFRGFYATSYRGSFMLTSEGVPTNAIYGFVRYLWDAIQTFQPTHVVCCWDMGSKTFRTERFDNYKANRVEPPVELIPQFDLVKDVVECMGIPNIGLKGYEADDLIGTLAKQYGEDHQVRILTGDHDSLQLVSENVHSIIMKKGMSNYAVYTLEMLKEEKGLTPQQFIDLKGLMGDSSDNYPGVKGIGEKTALKLLLQYDSIGGILENLAELSKGIRTKIETDLEMLHLSRELAEIHCEVPIELSVDQCQFSLNMEKVRLQFEKLEFRSLLKMIETETEQAV